MRGTAHGAAGLGVGAGAGSGSTASRVRGLVSLAGGEGVLPKSWDELFGMNSKCEADSSKYPTRTELMAALNERREKLEAWFAALTDEDLMQPITGELEMFAKTVAQLGPSLSFHDGFHAAQISAARRASGLAPMF